mmetsp:Transcript_4249/g.7026  ORF Transcript_4249/g.7026 Transcript_4249/m.7026 type:complete len:80 (-) Transcript_4249:437-676(-)
MDLYAIALSDFRDSVARTSTTGHFSSGRAMNVQGRLGDASGYRWTGASTLGGQIQRKLQVFPSPIQSTGSAGSNTTTTD